MSELLSARISRRRALQTIGGALAAGLGGGLLGCGDDSGGSDGAAVEAWIYRPEYRKAIESILDAFERRLQNTPRQEQMAALVEIGKIANLRLLDLVAESTDPKKVPA